MDREMELGKDTTFPGSFFSTTSISILLPPSIDSDLNNKHLEKI
jgi:hypothetical protein